MKSFNFKQMRVNREQILLKNASKHLYYEVVNLIEMLNILASDKYKHKTLTNACLESLLIHARNLFYFLYPEKPKKDDVIINDFIDPPDEWDSYKNDKLKSQILKDFKFRIGKEIAHLTYSRIEKEQSKLWNLNFVNSLLDGIDKFLNYVPKELLDESWNQYYQLRKEYFKKYSKFSFTRLAYGTD